MDSHLTIPVPTDDEVGYRQTGCDVWLKTHSALAAYIERMKAYGYEVKVEAGGSPHRYPIARGSREYDDGKRTVRITAFGPDYPDAPAKEDEPSAEERFTAALAFEAGSALHEAGV